MFLHVWSIVLKSLLPSVHHLWTEISSPRSKALFFHPPGVLFSLSVFFEVVFLQELKTEKRAPFNLSLIFFFIGLQCSKQIFTQHSLWGGSWTWNKRKLPILSHSSRSLRPVFTDLFRYLTCLLTVIESGFQTCQKFKVHVFIVTICHLDLFH